jgi:YHS domain-containing protein
MNALRKSTLALVGLALAATSAGVAAPAPTPPAHQKPALRVSPPMYSEIYQKERYDSVLSVNDRCPVRGGRLTPSIRPTYVNRLPVGYCCHNCPPIFTEDPGPFLKKLGVQLRDPLAPARVASYDPSLRVLLNQEAYFFSGKETMKRFQSDPLRYSGPLTDPVSQTRFQPTSRSPKTKFKNRTFYFESTLTQRQFAVSPESYALRREN